MGCNLQSYGAGSLNLVGLGKEYPVGKWAGVASVGEGTLGGHPWEHLGEGVAVGLGGEAEEDELHLSATLTRY